MLVVMKWLLGFKNSHETPCKPEFIFPSPKAKDPPCQPKKARNVPAVIHYL
jgi:hypothetical protein